MPDYQNIARQYAQQYGIDPSVFVNQIRAESGFNPNAVSPAGARGIAQIMPATARGWGVNPDDPVAALDAAAKNMARYVKSYGGDYRKALAAYNAGPGAVQKYGGVPPYKETQNYIKKILGGRQPQGGGSHNDFISGLGGSGQNRQDLALNLIFEDDPEFLSLLSLRQARPTNPGGGGGQAASAPSGPIANGWKQLQKIAREKFGLQNDPGDSQTTGGRHSAGSEHYKGRAIDFGDARNSRKQLNAWYDYAKRAGYDVLDEGDHIHVSLPGGGI